MAKIICILGYVIAIISVLSNAQNISINKNNQYANNDVHVDAAATHTDTTNTSSITSTLNATAKPTTTIETGRSFINATAAAETEAAEAATVADAELTTEAETTGNFVPKHSSRDEC